MRILFLTQWFDPEPHFKGLIFAKELVRRGHEVEVLTGFPNYPGGKVYDGYKVRPYQREVMDGITVHRVPLYPSHDKKAVHRVANYASFALSAAVMGPLLVKKPDVIYAYHAPATIGLPAAVLKARFGASLVYDINDMWPDTLGVSGMMTSQIALTAVGVYCRAIYAISDYIVVVTPGFKKLLMDRGVPDEKITVIYNWTYESAMSEPKRDLAREEELGLAGRFNVVFAGTMGTGQALDAVLDASLFLGDVPEIQIVFIGGGVDRERLERRAREEQLVNVRFLPRQQPEDMAPIMAATDIAVVHLTNEPLFRITIPSKIQGYLAAGRVVLCAVRGDGADLVERSGGGIACPPCDPKAIAAGIRQLHGYGKARLSKMGNMSSDFYRKELSLAAGVDAFEKVFREVSRR